MFYEIFRFEMRRAFSRPAIYIYFFILFGLSFGILNAAAGAFEGISMRVAGDNIYLNSPTIINILIKVFNFLGIFIAASICSNIVFKDFQHNTLELMFTTPIRKFEYIFGRFVAAYLLSALAFIGIGFGIFMATQMPYLNADLFGPNKLWYYAQPYLTGVFPNILFICSVFFSLSLLLRSTTANWVFIVAIYILYIISKTLFNDLDNQTLAALLDPLGLTASAKVSSSNSAADMNEKGALLEGVFLYNRLLWGSVSILILVFTYFRLKLSYNLRAYKLFQNKADKNSNSIPEEEGAPNVSIGRLSLPKILMTINNWKVFLHQLKFEIKKLFTNPFFLLINLIGLIFVIVGAQNAGRMYDTTTYPVTYQIIDILEGSTGLFTFIIIIVFSSEMIWRDRDQKIHELVDTQPLTRWTSLISKFITLNLGIAFLMVLGIIVGIITQAFMGYYNFEIGLYFSSIFGISFVEYTLTITLAFFIHLIVNQKYMGIVLLFLYEVMIGFVGAHVLKHHLLIYSSGPGVLYSDMNGFGFNLAPYWIFKFYWLLIAAIMLIIVNQLWVNHTDNHWKSRLRIFKKRFNKKNSIALGSLAILTLLWAGYIFYNTNIKNDWHTPYEIELARVDYEKEYKKYETMAQPKITDVKLKLDFYPEEGNIEAVGSYTLRNKTNKAIDTLMLNVGEEITNFKISKPSTLAKEDEDYDLRFYALDTPIQPNESFTIDFIYKGINDGFNHSGSKNYCEKNGSFMYSSNFPSIGYSEKYELSGRNLRQKHNLPERLVVREINDPIGIDQNFITDDADFINYEATISTSSDQMALTVGELIKSWKENDRNYFQYKSEHPMVNYYALLSGRYEKYTEIWKPSDTIGHEVEISILHHPGHDYNISNMMEGVKLSLSNYSSNYSPYQFKQLRIVEFPRFASYAQSFPNMIPFSEGIGFIADLRELENDSADFNDLKIDYPLYVTSHEMGHQWWAHQVIAANVEGSQMLMESITQYSALKTMEKKYGKRSMNKFLRDESMRYLVSRGAENHEERPLYKVAPYQSSTYYNKGSLIMYGIDNYIGEDKLMPILRGFIKDYAFKDAPYPTTIDLVNRIKEAAPDSLKYYITDALEKITMYKTKVDSVYYSRNKDFTYNVTAKVDCQKYYIDGKGKKEETPCNDYIEFGIFNSTGKSLLMEKFKVQNGDNFLTFKVARKPDTFVLDPNYCLIQKDWDRNEIDIKKKKKEKV